jgi:hypothetical protein
VDTLEVLLDVLGAGVMFSSIACGRSRAALAVKTG